MRTKSVIIGGEWALVYVDSIPHGLLALILKTPTFCQELSLPSAGGACGRGSPHNVTSKDYLGLKSPNIFFFNIFLSFYFFFSLWPPFFPCI